ncbi:hypothetical protein [Dongia sedimenti]|uniref:DUF2029 domain-containing protein n=1 Tax=Dongia sedimenti TaxID=3064282 RepID=A0ABU0YT84_9PROT|nr:hypothetical protein [Rhodospirillaceae bacterium R-7]
MTEPAAADPEIDGLPRWLALSLLLALTILCAVLFINAPGTEDVSTWVALMATLDRDGLLQGYASIAYDIPPVLAALMWLAAVLGYASGLGALFVLKCMLVAAAVGSVLISYAWLRSPSFGMALLVVVVPNLALGYLDVLYLPFLLLSLRALQRRHDAGGAVFYGLTCMIKWQAAIVAPFFLVYVLAPDWRIGLRRLLPAVLAVLLIAAPFGLEPVWSLGRALSHPFISANAMNAMWLLTWVLEHYGIDGSATDGGAVHWLADASTPVRLAMALSKAAFALCYCLLLRRYMHGTKAFSLTLLFATAGFLAYFALNTGVHENHLYVACVLALLLGHFVPQLRFPAAMVAALNWVNLVLFYGMAGPGLGFSRVYGIDISIPFTALTLAVCGCYWWVALRSQGVAGGPGRA